MYYEVTGEGEPLVLLHGALGGAQVWGGQVAGFSSLYQVFAPEQRGRSHSPDVEGPISYQMLADDTIAFLEQVVGKAAFVVGASDGGVIGLLIAMQRPDFLRKLVVMGANFHRDGIVPAAAAMWIEGSPDDDEWAGPREHYGKVSPDGPDHFPIVFEKLRRMWREEPTLSVEDVAAISLPVLVMVGDDDVVSWEHTTALYEALPRGQLAVVPGASHALFIEKAELVNRLILDFLTEEGDPNTIVPMRRSAHLSSPGRDHTRSEHREA
jgi:pimeloyl-ACP methyl ester carboxylesterase